MIGKTVIFMCIGTLFLGTEAKSIHKHGIKMLNVGQSILELKLSHSDINRGVSIDISGLPNNRKEMGVVHYLPTIVKQMNQKLLRTNIKSRKGHHIQQQERTKSRSKILKALTAQKEKTENVLERAMKTDKKTNIIRNKRSSSLKEFFDEKGFQIEDLQQFSEGNDENDEIDEYSGEEETKSTKNSKGQSNKTKTQEQKKPEWKFVQSQEYNNYATKTIDSDKFNEDDELLKLYYGQSHPAIRRAAFNDHGSINDFLRFSQTEIERENRFNKQLYYGNNDNYLNDEEDDKTDEVYEEYDSYDEDYDY